MGKKLLAAMGFAVLLLAGAAVVNFYVLHPRARGQDLEALIAALREIEPHGNRLPGRRLLPRYEDRREP